MKRVHTVIVLADALRFMFQGLCKPDRIKVLYNGLPTERYASISRPLHSKSCTILFMGHLTFTKGFPDLIQAYKQLVDKYPRVRLFFAGAFPAPKPTLAEFLVEPYKRYFLEHIHKITEDTCAFIDQTSSYNAEYLGFISGEQKMQAFREADIFVLPSYTEGFSMAVLEAMAAGLPVIVTPVGALPEVVKDGVNGLFVKIGDIDDLAAKLEFLVQDGDFRRKIGRCNRAYVRNRFDVHSIAGQLVQIWQDAFREA